MSNNLGGTRVAAGMAYDAAMVALNTALGEHDAAKTQPATLTIDATNTRTLTAAEMLGNVSFRFTAAGATAGCTVNVPALNAGGTTMRRGFFAVKNDTGFALTVQKSGQTETPPTLTSGQRSILVYDGDNVYLAVPVGGGGGATDMDSLTDVDMTTTVPVVGDVLFYNGPNWVPKGGINAQAGTSYTLVLADNLRLVTLDNAGAIAVTVPTNATVAFPIGATVPLMRKGVGQVTVAGAVGVTVNKPSSNSLTTREQWSVVTLTKIGTDTWVLSGDMT